LATSVMAWVILCVRVQWCGRPKLNYHRFGKRSVGLLFRGYEYGSWAAPVVFYSGEVAVDLVYSKADILIGTEDRPTPRILSGISRFVRRNPISFPTERGIKLISAPESTYVHCGNLFSKTTLARGRETTPKMDRCPTGTDVHFLEKNAAHTQASRA